MNQCPFCKLHERTFVHVKQFHNESLGFFFQVECQTCKARGPWERDERLAEKAWNGGTNLTARADTLNNLMDAILGDKKL